MTTVAAHEQALYNIASRVRTFLSLTPAKLASAQVREQALKETLRFPYETLGKVIAAGPNSHQALTKDQREWVMAGDPTPTQVTQRTAALAVVDKLMEVCSWPHHCPDCKPLGKVQRLPGGRIPNVVSTSELIDLYACTQHGGTVSVIVRYGEDSRDHIVGNNPVEDSYDPNLAAAWRRYQGI